MKHSASEEALPGLRPVQEDHRPRWAVIRWIDRLNELVLNILALTLGVLALLGIAQVIARYIIGSPLTWSEEVIRFALIWSVFLGAGIVVRHGMLVAVEAIYLVAPSKLARAIGFISLGISGFFWVVLMYYGWTVRGMVGSFMSGSLELPMSIVYLAIPAGAALALINTIVVAIDPPEQVITQAAS